MVTGGVRLIRDAFVAPHTHLLGSTAAVHGDAPLDSGFSHAVAPVDGE